MSDSIILIVDDLMFLPKLENGLRHLGFQPIAATNETDLTLALSKSPVLTIVDLFSQSFDWVALIHLIKESEVVPVLGFGPHVDLSLREAAPLPDVMLWLDVALLPANYCIWWKSTNGLLIAEANLLPLILSNPPLCTYSR